MYGRQVSFEQQYVDESPKRRRYSDDVLLKERGNVVVPQKSASKGRRHSVYAYNSPVYDGDEPSFSSDSISGSANRTRKVGYQPNKHLYLPRSEDVGQTRRKSSAQEILLEETDFSSIENGQGVIRRGQSNTNQPRRKISFSHELYNETLLPSSSSSDTLASSPTPLRRNISSGRMNTLEVPQPQLGSNTLNDTPRGSSPIPTVKSTPRSKMDTLQIERPKSRAHSISDISQSSSFSPNKISEKEKANQRAEERRRKSVTNSRPVSISGTSDSRPPSRSSTEKFESNRTSSASTATTRHASNTDESMLANVFKTMTPADVGLPSYGCTPRKYLWPLVISVLVISVIVSLILAFYFANTLKDEQEQQIEYLQAMLTLKINNLLNGTDINNLPTEKQTAFFKSYCEQIDSVYMGSRIKDGYSDCKVNFLRNNVINFTLSFSDTSTTKDDIMSVIKVVSSNNRDETRLMTISKDIVLVLYLKDVTINITTVDERQVEAREQKETTTVLLTTKDIFTSVSVTPTAGKIIYSRKQYPANPCLNETTGQLHPHPDDCHLYIHCSNKQKSVKPCDSGLVFYPEYSLCMQKPEDWDCPDMTPCEEKPNGHFEHPYNCTLFIQCDHGNEIVRPCSNGTVWDQDTDTCTAPEDVLLSHCKRRRRSNLL